MANAESRGRVHGRQPVPRAGEVCIRSQMEAGLLPHLPLSRRGPTPSTKWAQQCGCDACRESWARGPLCKSGVVTGGCLQGGAHWARPPLGIGSTRQKGRRGAVGVGLSWLALTLLVPSWTAEAAKLNPGPRIPRQVRAPHTRRARRNPDPEQSSVGAREAGGASHWSAAMLRTVLEVVLGSQQQPS